MDARTILSQFTSTAAVLGLLTLGLASQAHADYQQRFTLGGGVWHMDNPSQTDFELGVEYEYRVNPGVGLGFGGNYVFSDPAIGLVAAPEVYLHPIANEWYVSAAPLFEFGSGIKTKTGVRLGTRIPVPMGALTVVPSASVDLIGGSTNLIFGLGFEL